MDKTQKIGRYAFLWQYAKRYIFWFGLAELCLLVQIVGRIILPLVLSLFINTVLIGQDTDKVSVFIFAFLAIMVAYMVATYAYLEVWTKLYNKFVHNLRLQVFDKILYSRADYLTDMNSGDIVNRIQHDTRTFLDIVLRNIFHPTNNLITIIGILCIIAFINIWLACIALLLVILPVVITRLLSGRLQQLGEVQRNNQGNYLGWLNQILSGAIFVRLFYDKQHLKQEFGLKQNSLLQTQKEVEIKTLWINNITQFVSLVVVMTLYFVSFWLIKSGDLDLGTLIAVVSYVGIANTALSFVIEAYLQLSARKVNIDKVRELVELQDEVDIGGQTFEPNNGDIDLCQVGFAYDSNKPVLRDVDLHIDGGSIVGFVGESGVGKSTIAELILRFFEVDSGKILIGGVDISTVSLHSLRQHVLLMQQSLTIFDGTIEYNLKVVKQDATESEMEQALQKANLYEFVQHSQDRLQTIITENKLSGGEKQRLILARIFLRNPKIIIYDEPTSALDSINEREIVQAIKNGQDKRTIIIISHRLDTIKHCDKIFVVEGTQIKTSGSCQELLQSSPYFRQLFSSQIGEEIQ